MIAAFLEIHHDVEQRHLRRTAACVQRFKVPRQYVLVVLPATHTAPRSASLLSRQRDTARVCYRAPATDVDRYLLHAGRSARLTELRIYVPLHTK